MTTPNEAKEAVYKRIKENYRGVPLPRIVFDNEDEPVDTSDSWIRVSVRGIGRAQDTLGKKTNRRFRQRASAFVQVYTETNTGVQLSDALAKEAADLFEGESFSGLDFQEANIQEVGPKGKWFQNLVEAPFDYDEIK